LYDCPEALRWLRQARYTLDAVNADLGAGFYAWACFKAQQAAELALKGLLRGAGLESFGHDLIRLWRRALEVCEELRDLQECVALLNKMYIPPRYPDAWSGDATPFESYTRRDALEARGCAEELLRVVEECVRRLCEAAREAGQAVA